MPRYTYDPVTQRYTLLPEAPVYPMAPSGGIASLATPFYGVGGGSMGSDGGDASASGPSSSGTGSGGIVGDLGLGLSGYGQTGVAPGAMAANLMGPVLSDLAISQQANVMSQLADANAQANEATVTQGPLGPAVSTAVGISPVAPPATPTISEISPTQALASMNAESQAESQSTPVAALASSIASAISAAEDAAASTSESGAPGTAASGVSAAPPASDAAPPPASDAAPPPADGNGGGDAAPPPGDGPGPSDGSPGTSAGPSSDGDGNGGSDGEREGGIISMKHRYAQGGMPNVARHVQSQGRGQDKMLVHMTPQEVQGLQYLAMRHGGSLTVNPQTGLVEAGFLSNILPMIAGMALAPLTAGTSLAFLGATPLASALTVGGITGLATGSLKKGLTAGLGAFGGAGLGSAFMGAGTAAAPIATGTEAGLTSAGEMAASNVAPEILNAGTNVSGVGSPYFQAAQSNIDPGLLEGMNAQQVASAPVLNATPGVAPSSTVGFERMGEGIKNIAGFGTPEQADIARGRFMTDVGGITGLATKAGAAAAPILIGGFDTDAGAGVKAPDQFIRPFKYDIGRREVPYRMGTRGESTGEQLYFDQRLTPVGVFKTGTEPVYGTYAEGGNVGFDSDLDVNVGQLGAYSDNFYGGGLTALAAGGKTLPPRYLEGDGDGMSDSIKARIGGVQEARLADGEFVIPADVVSHIGNGSSNAGAKKLHDMMNRIRKARTGKKKQAPEVKTEQYMPA